ncbi:MAG: IPTL-CTERM sorting domain-containing protein [candidate division Zixibacteria bacterium]|nr:IPTL-CTERM sorting domain-containing protein [candidate division Zixibacteria bacterium]
MKKLLLLSALFILLSVLLSVPTQACCFTNKDVHNGTGVDAYDLEIEVTGLRTVEWHFDGYLGAYRFAQFSTWKANGKTYLRWFDPRDPAGNPAPIPHCSWVHIGYQLNLPAPYTHGWWTDAAGNKIWNGHIQQPSHYFYPPWTPAPQEFPITNARLVLRNDFAGCPYPTIIRNITFAVLPEEIPLDSLNAQNAHLASMLQPLATGPFTMDSVGDSVYFDIPTPIPFGSVVVYRFEGGIGSPNEFVDFGQHHWVAPPGVIPTLTEWGLIIFAVLLVGFMTWVVVRRRRRVTIGI